MHRKLIIISRFFLMLIFILYPTIMTAAAITLTAKNTDIIGIIFEEMAYQSYVTLCPAYIDICVKNKFSRDEESAAVLDIILDNYGIDLTFAFQSELQTVNDLRSLLTEFSDNVASTIESNRISYEKTLVSIVDSLNN